jgi:HK97 gp10 family phage protein
MIKSTVTGIKLTIRSIKNTIDKVGKERTHAAAKTLEKALEEATPVDTGYAQSRWEVHPKLNNRYEVANDAEYIEYLNAGSSQQAPKNFIEKTVLEQKDLVPDGTIVVYR